ncbi:antitoxin component HigA of HigAB toxin-antitoxin module [Chitinophaga skermanii]|uniref:Antitoxin component HigA of HigAB toxin-antitoxin module n=1 Tax=Chitinophaga skermanii TaxID=331697 RepID=A0A327R549_9BACT|nr:helix-turn-helix domain-containing protein [Chitinophaga skermanii]RAJ10783.1 antitoxin component HigA of HigAB toxin-antitoxin module [Chitinophaga skermanii]
MEHITSKKMYHETMAEIEAIMAKGSANLTPEDDEKLDRLSEAVEIWEAKHYPMPMKPDFKTVIYHVMITNGFNQTQLSEELRISKAYLSGLLKGSKNPNLDIVKSLHNRFHLDGNMLLDCV